MPGVPPAQKELSPSQKALYVIEELKARLRAEEDAKTEPIAIVGMGCRFPGGAVEPEAFWRLLSDGKDAVTEVPPDRWDVDAYYDPDPKAPGKMYTRHGAFIKDIDRFDSDFFGISPREAVRMDPQQRLLMEVTWEALERAGQAPDRLKQSRTGVFIGLCTDDYAYTSFSGSFDHIDAYTGMGTARNIAAGRLAHFLGLHGPVIQIDTACSSTLTAAHLACHSLRTQESDLAIVGGANLLISPGPSIFFCKVGALSPDGRCKTFDAAANGYVRGEGCGVIILKRLSDALSSGAPILSVIRGSAMNHDGPSGGLTVPNGQAQATLIREALKNAKVTPAMVDYIEAHGTGTSLGDAIEIDALCKVFASQHSKENPLVIGSVKTNVGHLEAVAGLSGLFKVVLSLMHKQIPPHLHLNEPNRKIDWDSMPIKVPTHIMPWPRNEHGRIGGVSSFGFSGTNVHLVLEEAPAMTPVVSRNSSNWHVLTLSAKSALALKDQSKRLASHLNLDEKANLERICYTANLGRAKLNHRLAVVAQSKDELQNSLLLYNREGSGPNIFHCLFKEEKGIPGIAFQFTGNATAKTDTWRKIYESFDVFRDTLAQCDRELKIYINTPLTKQLLTDGNKSDGHIPPNQTLLFRVALEYSMFQTWLSLGVEPRCVMGYGVGQIASALAAGVFGIKDAMELTISWAKVLNGNSAENTQLKQVTERIAYKTPRIRIVSGVSADPVGEELLQPEYWQKPLLISGRNETRLPSLDKMGCSFLLRIGATDSKILFQYRESSDKTNGCQSWGSEDTSGRQRIIETAGLMYIHGVPVNWEHLYQGRTIQKVHLPTYPFRGRRFWIAAGNVVKEHKNISVPTVSLGKGVNPKVIGGPIEGNKQLKAYYKILAKNNEKTKSDETSSEEKGYIRFAPLHNPIPGFSWFLSMADPKTYRKHAEKISAARSEMEAVLFRGLDFSAIRRVVDIGCGYSRDLISMAQHHPHLRLDGCNISQDQIAIGQKRIIEKGLDQCINLFEMDSSRDALPGEYDLIIGFQVIHHIKNKQAVLSNIGHHICNGGFVILAEIISNLEESINHPESSAYFATKNEWAVQLARQGLRIVACVDSSREIGNFLFDPDFEANLEMYVQQFGEGHDISDDVRQLALSHVIGPNQLGDLLRRQLACYAMLTIQKDNYVAYDTLLQINSSALAIPTLYEQAAKSIKSSAGAQLYYPIFQSSTRTETNDKDIQAIQNAECSDQRDVLLQKYLCTQLSSILEAQEEKIDPNRSLLHLGLDSIMALELKQCVQSNLQIDIPLEFLVEGPTVYDLVKALSVQLDQKNANSSNPVEELTGSIYVHKKQSRVVGEL